MNLCREHLRGLAALLVPVLTACGAATQPPVTEISLVTEDGVTLEADLCGEGDTGLVLAHGMRYLDGKESFRAELEYFGSRGLRALALSFRGYPAAEVPPVDGQRVLDLLAAVRRLRSEGCERVYVLGSSMGGFVALAAAPRLVEEPGFAGLIVVSAGSPGAADAIACPKLFVWSRDDRGTAERMEAMMATAADPKDTLTLEQGGHGQRLFATRGRALHRVILAFVGIEAPPS